MIVLSQLETHILIPNYLYISVLIGFFTIFIWWEIIELVVILNITNYIWARPEIVFLDNELKSSVKGIEYVWTW